VKPSPGATGFSLGDGFAANGYGAHSPGSSSLASALTIEFVLTFMFLMIILGATDQRAPAGFAPLAIGLALTLIHLISIPVTNTSVNPARSTGPALFVGGREGSPSCRSNSGGRRRGGGGDDQAEVMALTAGVHPRS
jgi:glycerol uptake facilitator-like aquaporin